MKNEAAKSHETGRESLAENEIPPLGKRDTVGKESKVEMQLTKGIETGLGKLAENGVSQNGNEENDGIPQSRNPSRCPVLL